MSEGDPKSLIMVKVVQERRWPHSGPECPTMFVQMDRGHMGIQHIYVSVSVSDGHTFTTHHLKLYRDDNGYTTIQGSYTVDMQGEVPHSNPMTLS